MPSAEEMELERSLGRSLGQSERDLLKQLRGAPTTPEKAGDYTLPGGSYYEAPTREMQIQSGGATEGYDPGAARQDVFRAPSYDESGERQPYRYGAEIFTGAEDPGTYKPPARFAFGPEQDRVSAPGELEAGLAKDILKGEEEFQEVAGSLGVKMGDSKRTRKAGIRIGKKIVAEREYQQSLRVQQSTIQALADTVDFRNETEKQSFVRNLDARMNYAREKMMEKALESKMALQLEGVNRRQQQQHDTFAGQFMGTVAGGIVGGYFGGVQGVGTGAGIGGALGGLLGQGGVF